MNCLVVKKIKKKINGYLKNITENLHEEIKENAIFNKNKITYVKNNVKHEIIIKENQVILIRETNEFKNILTFSKNRSILSEYIVKENNLSLYIEVETLELTTTEKEIYIKYKIIDSNTIYEYKIIMED